MSSKQFKTPFCKVCFDAGKAEKEYTSHYVRSEPGPKGKVVCPTLLSQECGYCRGNGHTPKFCTVLIANKVAEEKTARQVAKKIEQEKQEAEKKTASSKKLVKNNNKFAALSDDADDEGQGDGDGDCDDRSWLW